ncbi:Fic/DOC family N-terminal domain-containing protein [Archangium sp.]|uniref:Fic/DOC family N-terminal domain-containing protein n=1 Tax=Archangium sp. TaxID=1872627 RepID=UPI0038D35D71
MKRGLQGKWVKRTEVEAHQAFVPNALPPLPPLDLAAFAALTERANRALGRLDGVSTMLPDTRLFLYFYVRREAVLSSQIEGTQSSTGTGVSAGCSSRSSWSPRRRSVSRSCI